MSLDNSTNDILIFIEKYMIFFALLLQCRPSGIFLIMLSNTAAYELKVGQAGHGESKYHSIDNLRSKEGADIITANSGSVFDKNPIYVIMFVDGGDTKGLQRRRIKEIDTSTAYIIFPYMCRGVRN